MSDASKVKKIDKYIKEFGEDVFCRVNLVLWCKMCEKAAKCLQRFSVKRHIESAMHKAAVIRKRKVAQNDHSLEFPESLELNPKQSVFSAELCDTFISAGIPLWKLQNVHLRNFLEKYTQRRIPTESSLRKCYLEKNYERTLRNIRDQVGEKHIWVSIDETTDVTGRYIANTIIGILDGTPQSKVFLLNVEQLQKTNSSTVAQAVLNSLSILWPDGIKHEKVLLLVTDAAPYMKKAARALQVIFPSMIFITCLAHGLHRVAEEVRKLYPNVDSLISNAKKVFLKANSRVEKFKEMAPGLPLPPQPVITRWGTWVEAAIYYAKNFEIFSSVMQQFDDDAASSIKITKRLLTKNSVKLELTYIYENFAIIPNNITKLQKCNLSITQALDLVDDVVQHFACLEGKNGVLVKEKFERVIKANKQFESIRKITATITGATNVQLNSHHSTLESFTYAPITSVDVERSFSDLKYTLSDRRQCLSLIKMKMHLVIKFNK